MANTNNPVNPNSPQENGDHSEFNLPEWETASRHRGDKQPPAPARTFKRRATDGFNRMMPAHRKYLGLSRKIACIIFLVVLVVIMVLVIGLAAGLSHRSK